MQAMIKNFFGHLKAFPSEVLSQSKRFFSEEPIRKRLKHKVPQKRYSLRRITGGK
jgi:hypothetical protein